MPLLEVSNLTTAFQTSRGEITAVEDVSFSLNEGEILGIVGESGSGKSVTALTIMGLLPQPPARVAAGEVRFGSDVLTRLSDTRMQRIRGPGIAMVFQEPMTSLNPVFTIGEQVMETLRAHERLSQKAVYARALEMLEKVGIPSAARRMGDYPHQLSGGQRQRVMLAIALACRPRLLIADEPTSALDASLARASMDLLTELTADTGASLIIVSHDIHLCLAYSNRLLVMYRGELVEQVASSVAQEHATHPYTIGLLRCVPTLESVGAPALPTLPDVMSGAGVTGDTSGPAGRDRQS
jgi:peptide/nickel transport system ATP-binding protein/oligopeptide transport system ATP-binding protein